MNVQVSVLIGVVRCRISVFDIPREVLGVSAQSYQSLHVIG